MKFPIPQDWDGVTWCRWAVCWPASEGWEGFLRGLLTLPQRGWTWDEKTGSILSVQAIGREITAQNLPLNGVIMACNDENIASAFLDIAASIRLLANKSENSGCCDDSPTVVNNSIQNFIYQPVGGNPVPVYGSKPPGGIAPGAYPDGYDSLDDYQADKCSKANALINAAIVSLRAFAAFELAQFSGLTALTIMAISGVLVVGPFVIPALIAALILMAAAIHYLDAAADDMVLNRADWVCALYDSDSTEGIIGAIADLLDILVAAIGTVGPISFAVKTVVLVLLNTDNLNKLFTSEPMLAGAGVDCSECGCGKIVLDFTSENFGYTFQLLDCGGGTPSTAGASVSWSAAGLAMEAPNSGATNASNASGDAISVFPEAADILRLSGKRLVDTVNFVRVDLVVDGDCVNLGSGGFVAMTTTAIEISLAGIEGLEITQVNIYVNNSIGQAVGVVIEEIYIGCP